MSNAIDYMIEAFKDDVKTIEGYIKTTRESLPSFRKDKALHSSLKQHIQNLLTEKEGLLCKIKQYQNTGATQKNSLEDGQSET